MKDQQSIEASHPQLKNLDQTLNEFFLVNIEKKDFYISLNLFKGQNSDMNIGSLLRYTMSDK